MECMTNGYEAAILKNLIALVVLLDLVVWELWCVLGHHVGPQCRL